MKKDNIINIGDRMFGAIIGDTVGSVYEFKKNIDYNFELLTKYSEPTDDTIMTLAVADILSNNKWNDNNYIVKTFKKWGRAYPDAGYGHHFYSWLMTDNKEPYNSCGNGSAMRISACGWYGNSYEEVKEMAINVTAVTHNHPEGIKGAIVVAECIYMARLGKTKEEISEYVLQHYDINLNYEDLKKTYHSAPIICQVTVPVSIYCFLISKNFEDCLRLSVALGGDADTTAAIACSIAEAYYKEIDKKLLFDVLARLKHKNGLDIERLIDDHLKQL